MAIRSEMQQQRGARLFNQVSPRRPSEPENRRHSTIACTSLGPGDLNVLDLIGTKMGRGGSTGPKNDGVGLN